MGKTVLSGTLGILVKFPEPGRVKTRLEASLGDDAAAAIYVTLVDLTLKVARELRDQGVAFTVFCEPSHSLASYAQRWEIPLECLAIQQGATLGDRLANAAQFQAQFGLPFLLIGSDCAELTAAALVQGFKELDSHDVVVGPATDGGYYAIGMRKYQPDLFAGIAWSTDQVFRQTLQRAQDSQLQVALLKTLSDVDVLSDVPDWLKKQMGF